MGNEKIFSPNCETYSIRITSESNWTKTIKQMPILINK